MSQVVVMTRSTSPSANRMVSLTISGTRTSSIRSLRTGSGFGVVVAVAVGAVVAAGAVVVAGEAAAVDDGVAVTSVTGPSAGAGSDTHDIASTTETSTTDILFIWTSTAPWPGGLSDAFRTGPVLKELP